MVDMGLLGVRVRIRLEFDSSGNLRNPIFPQSFDIFDDVGNPRLAAVRDIPRMAFQILGVFLGLHV